MSVTTASAPPRLPAPPPEPSVCTDATGLPPKFRAKLANVLLALANRGWRPVLRETIRSDQRARWLFGFGRTWDDGRGVVTNVPTGPGGWHFFALAADLGDRRHEPGQEPKAFWDDVRSCAAAEGLTSGSDWNRNGIPDDREPGKHFCDRPHVQWYCPGMLTSPSEHAAELFRAGGLPAVWAVLHAL